MQPDRPDITIRPMTEDDLPMVAEWIARPHWQEWWGDAGTESDRIRDMLEGRDTTRPFIFQAAGQAAGYTQYWFVDDQKNVPGHLEEFPWLGLLPAGTVGVDISIAEANSLSRGIGSAVVQMMAEKLWADNYHQIIIDPDPANKRAVRAYEKAGFRVVDDLLGKTQDFLIMRFDPGNLKTAA